MKHTYYNNKGPSWISNENSSSTSTPVAIAEPYTPTLQSHPPPLSAETKNFTPDFPELLGNTSRYTSAKHAVRQNILTIVRTTCSPTVPISNYNAKTTPYCYPISLLHDYSAMLTGKHTFPTISDGNIL